MQIEPSRIRRIREFLEVDGGKTPPPEDPEGLGLGAPEPEGNDPVLINPKLDPWLKKGYSEKDLAQFFNLETGELKPEYASYEDKGSEPVLVGYKNGKPVYKDVKSHIVFTRSDEKGGSTVDLYVDNDGKVGTRDNGAQPVKRTGGDFKGDPVFENHPIQRAVDLKMQGITDDMLSKYYTKTEYADGTEGYVLKDGYSIENTGAGKDSQNGKDYTHRFKIIKEHKMGDGKNASYTEDYVYVYTDGTTAIRHNDGLTKEESAAYLKKQKDDMLAKGYTEEMLDQYFDIESDTRGHAGYRLKKEYSDVKDMGAGQDIYGNYTHKFVFSSSDKDGGCTEVKVMPDGTIRTEIVAPAQKDNNPGSPSDPQFRPKGTPLITDLFEKIKELLAQLGIKL